MNCIDSGKNYGYVTLKVRTQISFEKYIVSYQRVSGLGPVCHTYFGACKIDIKVGEVVIISILLIYDINQRCGSEKYIRYFGS